MQQNLTDFYTKNMALLKTHHPHVWETMIATQPNPVGEIFVNDSQKPNLRIVNPQKEVITMHSDTDPEGVADNFLNKLPEESTAFVSILGMGLGYGALAVTQKCPNVRHIAIFELNPGIFIQALQHMDLSLLLTDHRVTLDVSESPDIVKTLSAGKRALMMEDIHNLKHLPSFSLNPENYKNLYNQVFEYVNGLNVGGNTTLHYGETFLKNRFKNLNTIHHHYLFEKLQNQFTDVPAIIVAGGPSLDKNIGQLKKAQGKAVIIAVDSALPALLAQDITPNFVTALDPQDLIYEKVAHVCNKGKNISLICMPWVSSKIPKIFPAKKVFWLFSASPMEAWLNTLLGGTILTGGSGTVAHLNFQAASIMGCSPIIFVGQDLAYTGHKDHAQDITLTHQDTMDKTFKSDVDLVWVDGVNGNKVPTNRSFYNMKIQFEKMIESSNGHYINSTEGGVHIQGTTALPLDQAIKRYCITDTNVSNRIHSEKSEKWHPEVSQLLAEFRNVLKKTKEIKRIISSANHLAKKVSKEIKKLQTNKIKIQSHTSLPRQLRTMIDKIDAYHKKLDKQKGIWQVLEEVTMEGVRDTDRKRQGINALKEKPQYFLEWLLKSLEFLEEVNAARSKSLNLLEAGISSTLNFQKNEKIFLQKQYQSANDDLWPLELARIYYNSGDIILLNTVLQKLNSPSLDLAEANFYKGVLSAYWTEYDNAYSFFAKAISLDPIFQVKERSFREMLADEYRTFGKNKIIDSNSCRKMLIKGLHYCNDHKPLIKDIQDKASKDLNLIQNPQESDNKQKLNNLIRFWHQDLEEHKNLRNCLLHEQLVSFYHLYANLLYLEKDFTGTLEMYSKIIKMAPDNPEIQIQITDILFTLGEYTQGIKHLKRAVELNKSYAKYWENLGDHLEKTDQYHEALTAYEQCLIALPEHSDLLKKIGDCYLATNQPEAAKEAYEALKVRLAERRAGLTRPSETEQFPT
ncbi:MAG: DUF115 domain-containing protein [Desulfobulbaceae bacterium]|nr:DUF115 domain-containing protein [Desulfobulbaceae bacterium]HIJ79501.1 DUF115 domain-containing protein [Deltaproteobacteria bacterium]